MTILNQPEKQPGFVILVAMLAGVFPAVCLSVPHGYGVVLSILGLLMLAWFGFGWRCAPAMPEVWQKMWPLTLCFLIIPFGVLLSTLATGESLRALDFPARWLWMIPLLYFFFRLPLDGRYIWRGIALGVSSAFVVALLQKTIGGIDRPGGFTNPIPFADISLLLACFCFFIAVRRAGLVRALYLLAALSGVVICFVSQTRGAFLLLPLLLVYGFTKASIRFRRATFLASFVLVLTFILVPSSLSERMREAGSDLQRYLSTREAKTSGGSRLELWRASLLIASERPILGGGENKFVTHLTQLVERGQVDAFVKQFKHAHNEWFDVLAKRGVLGLIFLAVFYIVPLIGLLRHRPVSEEAQLARLCGIWLIVGYLVFGLTQVMFAHNISILFYAVMLTLFWAITFSSRKRVVADVRLQTDSVERPINPWQEINK